MVRPTAMANQKLKVKGKMAKGKGKMAKGQAQMARIRNTSAGMGKNAAQEVMNTLKRLEKQGRPGPLAEYRKLKGHEAKRSFALKLSVDKEALWCKYSVHVKKPPPLIRDSVCMYVCMYDCNRLRG